MTFLMKSQLGWATPLITAFDLASLAQRLGHVDKHSCNARKQGRCPGQDQCSDCAWSEGPSREPR